MSAASRPSGRSRRARLVIADDHDIARAGLRAILASQRDLEVVGEASHGYEVVELAQRVRADLVLLDVQMSDLDGIEATRQLRQTLPTARVLIVATQGNPEYLLEALRAGAAGYILKGASRDEIVAEVRRVLRGESLVQSEQAIRLLDRLADGRPAPSQAQFDRLTPRELEVLKLVARGMTNRQIGRELGISPGTVKVNVERIIYKLGVTNRTQAAISAVEAGLVGPDPP